MSISKLPNGRYRVQVWDPLTGKNVSAADLIGGPRSFARKAEAKAAREQARKRLKVGKRHDITVAMFRDRWLTDPLFAPPKDSTKVWWRERTKRFAEAHGALRINAVDDDIVSDWLAEGNASTVPALRTMFNDAASAAGGRLIDTNPFSKLGLSRGKGNAETDPPPEDTVWQLIDQARRLSGPYWSAWLQVAAFTGMRPAELDALRWESVSFASGRIEVVEQFNFKTGTFTSPKNGRRRRALMTPQARAALAGLPRTGEFCFVNTQGHHFTHKARTRHWTKCRDAVGYTGTLYLATRHFFGHYAVNVLEQESEDVAILLGHEDGGKLVRELYGHRDRERALDRAMQAITASTKLEAVAS